MATIRQELTARVAFPGTQPDVMHVGTITAPRRAEKRTVRVPEPGPTEILIRVEGCGICGSNLPVWEGRPWFTYPLEPGMPGHESWGVVERVGPEVTRFAPGDPVALLMNRGFAQYELAPESMALLLPEALAAKPFPGEPLACAMNAARRSGIREGETVAIVGVGFLGAMLTKLASLAGGRVAAISRRKFAREIAGRFGAEALFEWAADAPKRLIEWSGAAGFDCVIECVGTQEALDLATQLTKERGRLVVAGYHQDGKRQVDMQLWNWRGLDVINAHERDPQVYLSGMQAAVDAIVNGHIDPSPLYTHRFSLDELGNAFEMLRTRPEGFMKALVMP